jgi:hypothetical protein
MKLEIQKKENKGVIIQARLGSDKAEELKRIAQKHGFLISDILRSSIDSFIAQYGDRERKIKSA